MGEAEEKMDGLGNVAAAPVDLAAGAGVDQIVLAAEERRPALLRLIASARRELRIAIFRCDDFFVVDALAQAARRGIRLRVLLTPRAKGWRKRLQSLEEFLLSAGAEVTRYPVGDTKYHAKYVVADDGLALIGSANFTRKCFTESCDFLYTTSDAEIIGSLQRLFDADSVCSMPCVPAGLSERLMLGPNLSRERMTRLLESAQESIRIVDHRATDPEIVALLSRKLSEGVGVRVLGLDQLNVLVSHGKLVLVDGHTAVLGSLGLSPPSLDDRRELSVVVRDPDCVQKLNTFFEGFHP